MLSLAMIKKGTTLLFFFFVLTAGVFAQVKVKAGEGFDKIKIGMGISKALEVLGEPDEIRSRKEEQKLWEDYGYDVSKQLEFYIGFDKVYVFVNNNSYALWKVFVRKNKIVFLNISAHIFGEDVTGKISTDRNIGIGDSPEKVVEVMGKDFFKEENPEEGQADYTYFEKGIRFTFSKGILKNIYIFKSMGTEAKNKFLK